MPNKHSTSSPPSAIDYYDAPPCKESPPSAAPSDLSLEREIQLLRWMIRWLARNVQNNTLSISRLLSLLVRVIELSRDTSAADLRAELEEAGETVLRMLETQDPSSTFNFVPQQAQAHLDASLLVESHG